MNFELCVEPKVNVLISSRPDFRLERYTNDAFESVIGQIWDEFMLFE